MNAGTRSPNCAQAEGEEIEKQSVTWYSTRICGRFFSEEKRKRVAALHEIARYLLFFKELPFRCITSVRMAIEVYISTTTSPPMIRCANIGTTRHNHRRSTRHGGTTPLGSRGHSCVCYSSSSSCSRASPNFPTQLASLEYRRNRNSTREP